MGDGASDLKEPGSNRPADRGIIPEDSLPFQPSTLGSRIWPFAVVAALAQLSSAIPPGPRLLADQWLSLGALVLCSLLVVLLRADILPRYLSVGPPLVYCVAVTWLVLAQGNSTSGASVTILAGVVWTALYHRRWEAVTVAVATVAMFVLLSIDSHDASATILRRAFFWGLLSLLVSLSAQALRDHMNRSLARSRELERQSRSLNDAARHLAVDLDPSAVLQAAVTLAAELASPPGGEHRRSSYFLVTGDRGHILTTSDGNGFSLTDTWSSSEHPTLLQQAIETLQPRAGALVPDEIGDERLRAQVVASGVTHAAWVPIVHQGQIHGVLTVTSRSGTVESDLVVQLQALAKMTELSLANAYRYRALQELAITDELTGLMNRRGFEKLLDERPGRTPFAILAVDVDNLKAINDSAGHAAGDDLLRHVSQSLSQVMRRGDVLARVGGDEFAVLCFEADIDAATELAARMLGTLSADGPQQAQASISIGVAAAEPNEDARAAHRLADQAMYTAKRAGGGRWSIAQGSLADGQTSAAAGA
ncbi:MAG: sensor domain-containing diguanylate cyclase [Acidimicrobiales bacterium]|jgi:diguanylate cyclase (GGDEF)-like protein